MSCEETQEQVSLLIDAELEEPHQVALFRHLEGCCECRLFFDSMLRFSKAAKRDLEEIRLVADDILPLHGPLPVSVRAAGDGANSLPMHPSGLTGRRSHRRASEDAVGALPDRRSGWGWKRWTGLLAGGWRMPAPVAIGLALVLLVAGALVGTRISTIAGGGGPMGRDGRVVKPTVVVVCSLPEVQVLGSASRL